MIVALNSPEGKIRLEEVCANAENRECCGIQKEIVESFRKQRGNTVCRLASMAVVLTARNRNLANKKKNGKGRSSPRESSLPPMFQDVNPSDDCFVDEDDVHPMTMSKTVLSSNGVNDENFHPATNLTKVIVSEEKIRTHGMTLDQIRDLAESLPTTKQAIAFSPAIIDTGKTMELGVKGAGSEHNSQRQNLTGPLHLRELFVRLLSEPSSETGIVLNYHMSTLGQVPFGGHLSPVAACDPSSDLVLVMDVWHTQTEPVWAEIETIWKAIVEVDSESSKPRGLLQVVHDSEAE